MSTTMRLLIERDGQPVLDWHLTGEDVVVSALLRTAADEQDKARHRTPIVVEDSGEAYAISPAKLGKLSVEVLERTPAEIIAAYNAAMQRLNLDAPLLAEDDVTEREHEHTPEQLADGSTVCGDCGEVLAVDEEAPARG